MSINFGICHIRGLVKMKVLEVKNLHFYYDNNKPILNDLSFNVKKREFVSIVGGSGCGKSTIIKVLAGIEKITQGDIKVDNSVSYMPQSDTLFPWRTILDNILLPIEIKKGDLKKGKEKALSLLERFNLIDYWKSYPKELSGGMKQRISFIRTLMNEGELLLLDEPFSALDAITREDLQNWLLNSFSTLEKSIIFITHDIDEAIFLSNRILVCTKSPILNFKEFLIPKNMDSQYRLQLKKDIVSAIKGVNFYEEN